MKLSPKGVSSSSLWLYADVPGAILSHWIWEALATPPLPCQRAQILLKQETAQYSSPTFILIIQNTTAQYSAENVPESATSFCPSLHILRHVNRSFLVLYNVQKAKAD